MRIIMLALVSFLALTSQLMAVEPDEVLKDPALEARARALSKNLRCLVCQNESIDESNASLAKDLRILLRERLVAGDTDDQAVNYLVNRFGEFVLLKPRFAPHTLILWLGPFVLLMLAVLFLLRARKKPVASVAEAELTQDEKNQLKKVLGENES